MSAGSRFALFSSCVCLLLGGPAFAQTVVLTSHGPSAASFPQGAVLRAGKVITLKTGDRLELLESGGSRVVNGPATVVAGQADGGSRTKLVDIFAKGQHARPGIAATRGFELQPAAQPEDDGNLWQVDMSEGGAACVLTGQKPAFARGDAGSSAPIRLSRAATGETRSVAWPGGALIAPWPATMPVTDREAYEVTFDDGSVVSLTWRIVTPSLAGVEPLAADLLDKGCYAQLDRLRAALGGPAG